MLPKRFFSCWSARLWISAAQYRPVPPLCRAVGVSICMLGTGLNRKERLFCVIAYLPKATVQAAIGSVPLSMGLPCGQLVLSVAVLAILITAPLGAIGIDRTAGRLLVQESPSDIAE